MNNLRQNKLIKMKWNCLYKTVVTTGVGGFLGSHLCRRLLCYGVNVMGVDINETS